MFWVALITFAISTKVCACDCPWAGMAFAGSSVPQLWLLISLITAGRWKNCSLQKHRRHPGSKNRVAAGCLIVYFFGCLVMVFDHSLLWSYLRTSYHYFCYFLMVAAGKVHRGQPLEDRSGHFVGHHSPGALPLLAGRLIQMNRPLLLLLRAGDGLSSPARLNRTKIKHFIA
jgi:hypothetical protein